MPTEAIEAQHKPAPEPRSGAILVLAYGLGPFAPTVLRQGSHNLPWTMVTLLVLLAWSGMAWRWSAMRDAVASSNGA